MPAKTPLMGRENLVDFVKDAAACRRSSPSPRGRAPSSSRSVSAPAIKFISRVDAIEKRGAPEAKERLLKGETSINREYQVLRTREKPAEAAEEKDLPTRKPAHGCRYWPGPGLQALLRGWDNASPKERAEFIRLRVKSG
jgi:hypothetical protein